jgi:hypothetical protein
MRKIYLWGCLTILSTAAFAQAGEYKFKRKIEKPAAEGYYAITLSPEICAASKSELADLRIYDYRNADTMEVPYILQWKGNKIEENVKEFALINDTYNEKCCSYLTLKFPEKKIINRIRLDVAESNFDKLVRLEGSNNGKDWVTIREHLRILRFRNGGENYSYTTLDFNDSEFSYFRLKFDDDSSPKITVTNAYAFENKITKGNYNLLEAKQQVQSEDKQNKRSEIIVTFPAKYMISHILLKNKGSVDFYRNINIYMSAGKYSTPKGEQEAWTQVGSGVISSKEENNFPLSNVKSDKLKIEILNYDNKPLQLDKIMAYSEEVSMITKLPASDSLYLYYSRENTGSPVYDLVHFREKIPAELPNIGYGKEEMRVDAPVIAKQALISNKTWLWIVMAAVILILGYFALSMIKKEQE